ncbi:MAG: hypothetical protein FJ096_04645 [Deltaproteobacteria bacterium]|nr:hypothetical protein [Deltaproteobacteria bacterium]
MNSERISLLVVVGLFVATLLLRLMPARSSAGRSPGREARRVRKQERTVMRLFATLPNDA